MSAVEVPAELVELCVDTIEALAKMVPSLDLAWQQEVTRMGRQLRALLPAPTCPNCGDRDTHHGVGGCEALLCDCRLSREALPQVRALLAAERDSKPAQREPRVWDEGDPEPGHDVQTVIDNDHDTWHRTSAGWRCDRIDDESNWARVVWRFGPLTEVLGGAR